MKYIFIITLIFSFFNVKSQQGIDYILYNDINQKYLEYLIKVGIDSVRNINGCGVLTNDSILYIAAKHHADYMLNNNLLSHFENKRKYTKTKTPADRIKYFGGNMSAIAENVLKTPYLTSIKTKRGNILETYTYSQLAYSIVNGWVNSPGHFKNIITSRYNLTGVAISVDIQNKIIYACQVFGQVELPYNYTNYISMFPYSKENNKPDFNTINSFDGISNKLLDHDHLWDIKHNNLSECESCDEIFLEHLSPETFSIKNGYFVIKIENADLVKQLIRNKKDGFAVEIIEYNDYRCGNPNYYLKPSRRNGQCLLNGYLLKPVYRDALTRGYKKRKKRKDINYLSFIIGADSIPFFQRSYQYKVQKFTSKYFEISLGKVPKNISGYWDYNLVTIKNNQICHVNHFSHQCDSVFVDYKKTDFIYDTNFTYTFTPETKELNFIMSFSKNSSQIEDNDVTSFLKELNNINYIIDSVEIKAYSSVEGDSVMNNKLQIKRAKEILNILQKGQIKVIKTKINTYNSWDHFRNSIKKYPEWKYMADLDFNKLTYSVNKNKESLEFILKDERKAVIKVFYSITIEDNLKYYIKREISHLNKLYNKAQINKDSFYTCITKLYKYTFKNCLKSKIDLNFLFNFNLPSDFTKFLPLAENYYFYNYIYRDSFNIQYNQDKIQNAWKNISSNGDKLSQIFLYNISKINTDNLIKHKKLDIDLLQNTINNMSYLKNLYENNKFAKINIDKLTLNHNYLSLLHLKDKTDKDYMPKADTLINKIYSYYKYYNKMDANICVNLSKTALYFNINELANEIILPLKNNDTIIAYKLKLNYHYYKKDTYDSYYNALINASKYINTDIWCDIFTGKCSLPIEVFDNERLWKLFCKKCLNK